MLIQLPQWLASAEIRTKPRKSEFSAFLEEQTNPFIERMQVEAENQQYLLEFQWIGADQEEVDAEMQGWWNHQIQSFQRGLKEEFRRDQERGKSRLHQVTKDRLQSIEIELEQTRAELAGERENRVCQKIT
jgi:hypothetical protein